MIAFFHSRMPVKEENPPPPQQPPRDEQVGDDRGDNGQFLNRLQV
jgi:hypothetical protein